MDHTLNRKKIRTLSCYYCCWESFGPLNLLFALLFWTVKKSAVPALKYRSCSIDSKLPWGITSKRHQNNIWASTYICKLICTRKNIKRAILWIWNVWKMRAKFAMEIPCQVIYCFQSPQHTEVLHFSCRKLGTIFIYVIKCSELGI